MRQGTEGTAGKPVTRARGAQVLSTLLSSLVQGLESATKQAIVLNKDHESPKTGSDVQEAVADILTTTGRYESQHPQGCTQGMEVLWLFKWWCSHT